MTTDKNRLRKTYPFFRQQPVFASGGGGGGGGGETTDVFWYSTTDNAIYTTGSVIIRGGMTSYDSPSDVGSDVFFYVSGSKNCLTGSRPGAAVFGGDVRISGSLVQGEHYTSTPIVAWGLSSHAEGRATQARGNYSHAEGTYTIAGKAVDHAEGWSSEARGGTSHAEGYLAITTNAQAHAEGDRTLASGDSSHAEGIFTEARGDYSHAQGEFTLASGYASQAEGSYTVAVGSYSQAAGRYTIASGSAQTVIGKFNKRDNSSSLFVIGNGTNSSNSTRSDILRVNSGSIQITGSLWQMSGSSSSTVGFMGSRSGVPTNVGTDIFFYVSGSTGTDKSVFGGDLTVSGSFMAEGDLIEISGSLVIEANTLEVTGTIAATQGLSGSLTQLSDGTSYLIAGSNITITSQSNGPVTISSTGGGSGGVTLQFLAGKMSSASPSGSMESVGMDYLDTTALPPTPTYTFSAIIAPTSGTTAYMDLYDYNGIIGGTPGPIAGSVLTGSSLSYTYLTADVSSALSLAGSSGIIEARIWCTPTGSNLNAICKSAKLTIS